MGTLLKFARYLAVAIWLFATAALVLLLCLVRPFNPRNCARFRRWCFPFSRRLLGVRLKVKHRERLRSTEPCIFIMNHQDTLDMFVIGSSIPDRTITIGKKSLGLIPLFGWMFYLSGNLLIHRKNHKSALATMQKARDLVDSGVCVILAPEGTRSRGKGLGPFKKGAFHLAVAAQVPLQPLVASSYEKTVDFSRWDAGQVLIDILEPIPTRGKTEADIPELMAESRHRMEQGIASLDAELSA